MSKNQNFHFPSKFMYNHHKHPEMSKLLLFLTISSGISSRRQAASPASPANPAQPARPAPAASQRQPAPASQSGQPGQPASSAIHPPSSTSIEILSPPSKSLHRLRRIRDKRGRAALGHAAPLVFYVHSFVKQKGHVWKHGFVASKQTVLAT